MARVDVRTRLDEDRPPVDPDTFFASELPAAIEAHAGCIVPALAFVAPRPLTVDVDGHEWSMRADDGRVTIAPGPAADAVAHVRLGAQQLDDLARDQQTPMSMWAANRLEQPKGNIGHLLDWWLVWRAALDGTPIHTPGAITFTDRDGAPLDLARTFRPGDNREEMRHFLEEAGFLHLSGVFDDDEMAAVSADMDDAVPRYAPDDGRSWWARTADGNARLVRMQGFDRESPTVRDLLDEDRFLQLATIPDAGHEFGTRRAQNRIEALFKPIGVTEGISDIPWHKDCGIGRHSYECCSLTVGISVTGADDVSGQLRVIAGSHRALIWSGIRQPDLDLPDIPLPTRTGDVTLHLSCTMHMAQPPVEHERRVMYSGFALPPLGGADPSALAAARARRGEVRESAPVTVLDRHFKS
jgi:phytanoyl-CoA dioxygenase PhyH